MNVTLLNGSICNLHSYWDSGAFVLQPNEFFIVRPLNESSK